MTRLLIAGATGLVGNLALNRALTDDRVSEIVALTRRAIAPHAKLRNVVVDFSNLPEQADWWSVDGVIAALGTTRAATPSPSAYRIIDVDYPLTIARYARAHGASRCALVSSYGADPSSLFSYTRMKGELEVALKAIGFPSLTILQPSVLDGDRDGQRPNERMATKMLRLFGPLVPAGLRVSSADRVAAALIEGVVSASSGVHIKTNADMT